jgi:hypothetical protein
VPDVLFVEVAELLGGVRHGAAKRELTYFYFVADAKVEFFGGGAVADGDL